MLTKSIVGLLTASSLMLLACVNPTSSTDPTPTTTPTATPTVTVSFLTEEELRCVEELDDLEKSGMGYYKRSQRSVYDEKMDECRELWKPATTPEAVVQGIVEDEVEVVTPVATVQPTVTTTATATSTTVAVTTPTTTTVEPSNEVCGVGWCGVREEHHGFGIYRLTKDVIGGACGVTEGRYTVYSHYCNAGEGLRSSKYALEDFLRLWDRLSAYDKVQGVEGKWSCARTYLRFYQVYRFYPADDNIKLSYETLKDWVDNFVYRLYNDVVAFPECAGAGAR